MLSPRSRQPKKDKPVNQESTSSTTTTESKKSTVVFGVPLSKVCEDENLPIPTIAEEVITYLENKGKNKQVYVSSYENNSSKSPKQQ